MRTTKYRAWDKIEKIMCKVTTINCEKGAFLVGNSPTPDYIQDIGFEEILIKGPKEGHFVEFHNLELLQYTGLKDKNGKEIYESDIVRSILSGDITIVRWLNHLVDSVEYKNNYIMSVGFCFTEPNSDEVEIIGNIYENPELITI